MNIIALIPAKCHSKRILGKNVKLLVGHPLMAYTIRATIDSGIFDRVIVTSNCQENLSIAKKYGAQTILRPFPVSDELTVDIDWVTHALNHLKKFYNMPDCFSILRPTSPFRQVETILRAWRYFKQYQPCDSIRAVELCKQHPHKMWQMESDVTARGYNDGRMIPFCNNNGGHNEPYQALPRVYIQNSSLEIAWVKTVYEKGSVSGDIIQPFYTQALEGFDINTPLDWTVAELLVEKGLAKLPKV